MKKIFNWLFFLKITTTVILVHIFLIAKTQGGAYGQLRSMTDYNPNIPMPSAPTPVNVQSATTQQMTQADYNRAYTSYLNETANKINNKGVKFYNEKKFDKALRYFDKALKYLPNSSTIKKNIENTQQQLAYEKSVKEQEEYKEKMRLYNEKKQKELERYNRDIAEKEISAAIDEIKKTKKQVAFIQQQLRSYSKELHNNNAEFEKWSAVTEDAYNNTIKNSKQYVANMFVKYGLLNALDPAKKIEVYNKFNKLLQSTNPNVQQWILKECKANNVDLEVMKGFVNGVCAGNDMLDILNNRDKPFGEQALNAILFVNSCFEGMEWVNYENLLVGKFKGTPAEYIEQAKMIGETYCDLGAQCYSWYNIKKLNNRTDEMAEKIKLLSNNMKFQETKMNCLQQCLNNAVNGNTKKNCVNNCSGQSRFSSPVPKL